MCRAHRRRWPAVPQALDKTVRSVKSFMDHEGAMFAYELQVVGAGTVAVCSASWLCLDHKSNLTCLPLPQYIYIYIS